MKDDFAAEANEMHKIALEHEFAASRIKLYVNTSAVSVNDEGLVCKNKDGEFTIECDNVLVCAGMRANWDTVEDIRYCAPLYRAVGDCVKPGKVVDATEQGYFAALDI